MQEESIMTVRALRPVSFLRAVVSAALAVAAFAPEAAANAGPSKDQCLEAHSRGQDLREQRRLLRSKEQFLLCSQASCPGAIQADCVKFLEQVDGALSSVSFGARDDDKKDLPDTQVFLDGVLMASRLDDGKVYDADPGPHVVRFVHDGKESTVRVVLTPGDKGRAIFGTFASPLKAAQADSTQPPPAPGRSALPLVFTGIGAAGLIAGGVLMGVGMAGVPSECSVGSHTCSAPPGSPVYEKAQSSMNLANVGLGVGLAGAAVTTASLIWYFTQSPGKEEEHRGTAFTPWLAPGAGGFVLSGKM
jgi:hypothetical protein